MRTVIPLDEIRLALESAQETVKALDTKPPTYIEVGDYCINEVLAADIAALQRAIVLIEEKDAIIDALGESLQDANNQLEEIHNG